jgi:hypothetical protein
MNNITVLIYNIHEDIVHKKTGLVMKNGTIRVDHLRGIIPGDSYRIVAIIPGYLPRQSINILIARTSKIRLKRFLPLDFNRDGTFNAADVPAIFRYSPAQLRNLFI